MRLFAFDEKGNKYSVTVTPVKYFKGIDTQQMFLTLIGNGKKAKPRKVVKKAKNG